MLFFEKFGKSALELKSLRCITVTGVIIALDLVLKLVSIKITSDLKITFAYLGLATIGMLFGPTVAFLAGTITDILGYLLNSEGGFSPLFTLVEAVGAMIYGIFLYDLKPLRDSKKLSYEEKKKNIFKILFSSLGIGAAVGVISGAAMFAVSAFTAPYMESTGFPAKVAAIFADGSMTYIGAIIGFIYGAFFTAIIMTGAQEKNGVRSSVKIILSKITVVIICNLIMTPMAMIMSGYTTLDAMIAGFPLRVVKNLIQCPVDCVIMLIILFPILAAYKKIFPVRLKKMGNNVGGMTND